MTNPSWRCLALGVFALLLSLPSFADTVARSRGDRVNVRSRPGYAGEVITQLERGQEVRITGTNTLSDPAPDEPPVWYRIDLPSDAPVWVNAEYIDAQTKEVTADILNVRAGPGVDYGVVARVPRGTQVKTKDDIRDGWLSIEAPAGAFGYVPANWITPDAAGRTPSDNRPRERTEPSSTRTIPLTETAVPSQPSVAIPTSAGSRPMSDFEWSQQFLVRRPASESAYRSTPTQSTPVQSAPLPPIPQSTAPSSPSPQSSAPSTAPVSGSTAIAPVGLPPQTYSAPTAPGSATPAGGGLIMETRIVPTQHEASDDTPEPAAPVMPEDSDARWVRREGLVIRPFNFAAPTFYALQARDSGKTINFLFTSRPEPINWREYRGKVVILTGREYLDKRTYWRGVPLLDVEEIEAVR